MTEEAAQRLPAVGDVEHQQALRRNRGAHLLRAKAAGGDRAVPIGEFSTERLVRNSFIATSAMSCTCGGNGMFL